MQAARIRKRRFTPKDARCRASAFEHKKPEAGSGSPPGSPYAVSVELMTTMLFSAWSTSMQSAAHTGRPPSPVQRQLRPIGRKINIRPQRPSRPLAVLIRPN